MNVHFEEKLRTMLRIKKFNDFVINMGECNKRIKSLSRIIIASVKANVVWETPMWEISMAFSNRQTIELGPRTMTHKCWLKCLFEKLKSN